MQLRTFLPLCCCALLLTNCSVSTRVDYENAEGQLGDDFFHELRDKKTDTDWVMANLGEPLFTENYEEENINVYTWQLSRADYKHLSILIVLRYNTVEREQHYLHVISKEGIVQKHWLDDSPAVQVHQVEKATK